MTRYFIKTISIEGFRGINNDGDPLVLKFKDGGVNSVHAPNGLGKTSIYEAIHFAIRGTVPRLQSLQEAEQGDTYIVNRFHPAKKATIALEFSSDDGTPSVRITVTRTSAGPRVVSSPSGHPTPEQFLASLQEDFVLVDYSRFAEFIDSSALTRGRSFSSLVGLSRYSHLRQALEGAKNTRNINTDLGLSLLDTEVTSGEININGIAQRIISSYNEVTGQAVAIIEPIETLKGVVTNAIGSIALLKPFVAAETVMGMDFASAEKTVENEEGGEARKKLDNLITTSATLSALAVVTEDLDQIDRLLVIAGKRDEAITRVGAAAVLALLKRAHAVVTSGGWEDPNCCPVCDARSDTPLSDKLSDKISLYEEAAQLDEELAREATLASCFVKLHDLENAPAMEIESGARVHIDIDQAIKRGVVPTVILTQAKAQMSEIEERRANITLSAQEVILRLQSTLPPSLVQVTRTLAFAKQFRDAVRDYDKALPAHKLLQDKLKNLNRWKKFITKAAQIFADAETNLANARLLEIQNSCQTLFGHLVRGGPDVKPTLNRAKTSENVDLILADFFGLTNLSARALLSESYRNAVAASIFLSAAIKQSGPPRFMILDDVTSSFDAGHQFSLMDAIRTRLRHGAVVDGKAVDGLQFIILSHDTSLEKYFDRLNGTTDWHHQKLQGMTPKGRLMVLTQEADRLKTQALTYLNAGQIDIGQPFVRQYLEYKLSQIISRLEVPVPPDYATRGDKRTLSTYMNAITEAVALYQAANCCVLTPQQASDIGNTHAPSIIANFISHYETSTGTPFNAYALLGVIQSIDDLAECFMCIDTTTGKQRYYRRLDAN